MKYRKKPVVIEARRFDSREAGREITLWCGGFFETYCKPSDPYDVAYFIRVPTLEGVMTACFGDWVIRGVKGEFYPCKHDIFEATYEPADSPSDAP